VQYDSFAAANSCQQERKMNITHNSKESLLFSRRVLDLKGSDDGV
jgi:hypothetical protein